MKTIRKNIHFLSLFLLLSTILYADNTINTSVNQNNTIIENQQQTPQPTLFATNIEQEQNTVDQQSNPQTITVDDQQNTTVANQEISIDQIQTVPTQEHDLASGTDENTQPISASNVENNAPEKSNDTIVVTLPVNQTVQNTDRVAEENGSNPKNIVEQMPESKPELETTTPTIIKVYPVIDAVYAGIEKIKAATKNMIDYIYDMYKHKMKK